VIKSPPLNISLNQSHGFKWTLCFFNEPSTMFVFLLLGLSRKPYVVFSLKKKQKNDIPNFICRHQTLLYGSPPCSYKVARESNCQAWLFHYAPIRALWSFCLTSTKQRPSYKSFHQNDSAFVEMIHFLFLQSVNIDIEKFRYLHLSSTINHEW
jgi:hypothetical protein